MKMIQSLFLGLSISLLAMAACDSKSPKTAPHNPRLRLVTVKDTISKDKFMLWTNNWQNAGKNAPFVQYFQMPLIDLSEVLSEKSVAASRFCMGLDLSTNPATPHLLLIGEDANRNPLLDDKTYFAYDVSQPCPSECGQSVK